MYLIKYITAIGIISLLLACGDKVEQTSVLTPITDVVTTYIPNEVFTRTTSGGDGIGEITYTSSDTSIATVNNSGLVIVKGAGIVTITATKQGDEIYGSQSISYKVTINKASQTSFNIGSDIVKETSDISFNQIAIGGLGGGAVTYRSSNISVASVSNLGVVSIIAAGTTTITATKAADSNYLSTSDNYLLTVVQTTTSKITNNYLIPAILFITFSRDKTFSFNWNNITGVQYYQILENSDGASNFMQIGGNFIQGITSYDYIVPLHKRINAYYKIRSYYANGNFIDSSAIHINDNLSTIIANPQPSLQTGDMFGYSLSISGDGNTLAVGAISNDFNAINSGVVYIFTQNNGSWLQQGVRLKVNDSSVSNIFSYALSLNYNGNILAIGSPNNNDNTINNSGAVYIFVRDNDDIWSMASKIKVNNPSANDNFGSALSLSGDSTLTLAVGSPNEDSNTTGINSTANELATNSGAVYVFTSNNSNTWTQQAYIKPNNPSANDNFGSALSLSGDSTLTLAVGSPNEDSNTTGINSTANELATNSGAVYALSLSGDSINTGINSTANELATNSGAVYVFTSNNSNTWTQQAYIKPNNPSANDNFGSALSLSGDSTLTLAVGSPNEDSNSYGINGIDNNNAINSGASYIFVSNNSTGHKQHI